MRANQSGTRYTKWDGTQQINAVTAEDIMRSIADELVNDGDLMRALRQLFREGIETADHLEFVRQRGCNRAQGFLIAPPIAADEAERMLLDRVPSL